MKDKIEDPLPDVFLPDLYALERARREKERTKLAEKHQKEAKRHARERPRVELSPRLFKHDVPSTKYTCKCCGKQLKYWNGIRATRLHCAYCIRSVPIPKSGYHIV